MTHNLDNSAEEKNKGGRPTDYSIELAEEICDTIASSSKGIKKLCRENEHWPSYMTIYRWLRKHKEFCDLYTQAKRDQIQVYVDEIIEISDESSHDDLVNKNGDVYCNSEWINRSRLRVDTRKWLAAKLVPRLYGEKIQNEHSGIDGKPIEYASLTPEQRNRRIAEILETARNRRASESCSDNREGSEDVDASTWPTDSSISQQS